MSGASSLSSMAQQLFLSLGVATAALLLHLSLGARGATTLTVHDFTLPFVVTGVLALLSSLMFLPLRYDAGAEVSGRRAPAPSSGTIRRGARAEPAPQVD